MRWDGHTVFRIYPFHARWYRWLNPWGHFSERKAPAQPFIVPRCADYVINILCFCGRLWSSSSHFVQQLYFRDTQRMGAIKFHRHIYIAKKVMWSSKCDYLSHDLTLCNLLMLCNDIVVTWTAYILCGYWHWWVDTSWHNSTSIISEINCTHEFALVCVHPR